MGFIRIDSTDVLSSLKHPYGLGEPLRTVRFFGRIDTRQCDSGESAGDLIPLRIHIRISSPL